MQEDERVAAAAGGIAERLDCLAASPAQARVAAGSANLMFKLFVVDGVGRFENFVIGDD